MDVFCFSERLFSSLIGVIIAVEMAGGAEPAAGNE